MELLLLWIEKLIPALSAVLVAVISARSNKKSRRILKEELKKSLQEKDAETSQILQRLDAELEGKKQLITWENSMPQVKEYVDLVGQKRYSNVASLIDIIGRIRNLISSDLLVEEDFLELRKLLGALELPSEIDGEKIYPHEVLPLMLYRKLMRDIDQKLQEFDLQHEDKNLLE